MPRPHRTASAAVSDDALFGPETADYARYRPGLPDAAVHLMGDGSLWTHASERTIAVRELIRTYLGDDRRAGTRGTYTGPDRSYEDDLAASAFSDLAEHRFPVTRAWTP